MPFSITKCKAIVALTAWTCMCAVFVLRWLPLPTLSPPIPATSPLPPSTLPHPPNRWPQSSPGHTNPAQLYSRPPQEWRRPVSEGRTTRHYDDDIDKDNDDYDENDKEINKRNNISGYYSYYYSENDGEEGEGSRNYNDTGNESYGGDDEYYYYEDDEGGDVDGYDVEYTGGQYNVTPPGARLLIYNRIPKCASSTMQTVLRWCARRLGFEHMSSEVYDQHQLTKEKRRALVYNLTIPTTTTSTTSSSSSSSLSYDRHLYYVDFTAEGAKRPVYINIVREPAERFISSFYYRRSRERLARISAHGHLTVTPSINWLNRTVEQCVTSGDPECSFTTGTKQEMILTYFCGHHESCQIVGSKTALQKAKQVVSKEYSVVGLVGHMETSLRLMQTLVPGYLGGALQSYHTIRKKEKVNKNSHKPAVPREVRQELRRRMAYDIDFYNFLKQRLFLQAKTFLRE